MWLLALSLAQATTLNAPEPAQTPARTDAPSGAEAEAALSHVRSLVLKGPVEVELSAGHAQPVAEIDCSWGRAGSVKLHIQGERLTVSPKGSGRRCVLELRLSEVHHIDARGHLELDGSDLGALESLSLRGALDVDLSGIDTASLEVLVQGASDVELSGRADSLSLRQTGASDVDAEDLSATFAEVSIAGAGDLSVTASESVSAHASGAADVDVYGSPDTVEQSTAGAADINIHGR